MTELRYYTDCAKVIIQHSKRYGYTSTPADPNPRSTLLGVSNTNTFESLVEHGVSSHRRWGESLPFHDQRGHDNVMCDLQSMRVNHQLRRARRCATGTWRDPLTGEYCDHWADWATSLVHVITLQALVNVQGRLHQADSTYISCREVAVPAESMTRFFVPSPLPQSVLCKRPSIPRHERRARRLGPFRRTSYFFPDRESTESSIFSQPNMFATARCVEIPILARAH